jgi:adenylate cyclase, class 2
MNSTGIEIEAKFYVPNLKAFREQIIGLGAQLQKSSVLEINWRFDTPDRQLSSTGQVLRLRQDAKTTFTYKNRRIDPHERDEIEFEIANRDKGQEFIEALGYEVILVYEKKRETLLFKKSLIMLDELPYGNFVEVEASSLDLVKETAKELNLSWKSRISRSYSGLFLDLRQRMNLPFVDATFNNFKNHPTNLSSTLAINDAWV